jgi:hypothetical protein
MTTTQQPHWFARSIGSAILTPVLLIVMVAFTLLGLGRSASSTISSQASAIGLTLIVVALGCAALAWVRPQRAGLSPPHVMLSLGFGGMMLGLLFDVLSLGTAQLESLCIRSSTLGFSESFRLHLEFLPGMHWGMFAGGMLAIPSLRILRPHCGRYLCSLFAQNLMCSGWMLLGMTAGAILLTRLQIDKGTLSLANMLGGMFVGMTWGMVISVALYRLFFKLRDRI